MELIKDIKENNEATGREQDAEHMTGDADIVEQEFYFIGTKDGFAKAIQEESPYERKGFDINKWDGSDIFLIDNFEGIPVVTQKVKDIFEKNRIKNIIFTNIKEFV